ncbi:MAG: hypothetical protein ABJA89_14025 [Lapillicoccus sp.]
MASILALVASSMTGRAAGGLPDPPEGAGEAAVPAGPEGLDGVEGLEQAAARAAIDASPAATSTVRRSMGTTSSTGRALRVWALRWSMPGRPA